jgi:hypothetical protein
MTARNETAQVGGKWEVVLIKHYQDVKIGVTMRLGVCVTVMGVITFN